MSDFNLLNIYTIGMAFTLLIIVLFPARLPAHGIIGKKFKNFSNKKLIICLFILFWGLISALRNVSVGTDTFHYTEIFSRIASTAWGDLKADVEFSKFPLYIIYNKIISIFFTDPNAVTFFNSAIFIVGVTLFLYRNSKNLGISVFLFLSLHFYFLSLNIARASLAIMITLWAYHFAKRNKLIRALVLNICAIFVHKTAALGLVVFFIVLFCNNSKRVIVFAIFCTIGIIFFKQIIIFAVELFPQYKDYVYTDDSFSIFNNSSDGKRKYIALFLLAVLLFCWFYPKAKNIKVKKDKEYWIFVALAIISIELMIIQNKNEIMARLELFFTYYFMVSIPYFIEKNLPKKLKSVIYLLTIFVLMVPFCLKLGDYLPYTTIFAGVK